MQKKYLKKRCKMVHGRFILIISFLVLAGCSSNSGTSPIQFLSSQNEEAVQWAAWLKADEGMRLVPSSIYALNKNIVFLFGSLGTPVASVRSFLLRSENGGKNWKEVMQPVHGSDVIKVLFVNKRTGWALVAWTTEAPDKLTLYGSKDSGKSWRKLSDIPKRHYLGWPTNVKFFDEENGQVEMLYDGTTPCDGFVVLNTSDGGLTWQEVRSLSLDEYKQKYETEGETQKQSADCVSGQDGSLWQLQKEYKLIAIRRRLPTEDNWRLMFLSPTFFKYSNGQVLPKSQ